MLERRKTIEHFMKSFTTTDLSDENEVVEL